MKLEAVIKQLQRRWASVPDRCKPNNNQQYEMVDAAMAALSVFFMQNPSFVAHQQALAKRTGRSNAASLFRLNPIPSDGQIRNLLEGLAPTVLATDVEALHARLGQQHPEQWQDFAEQARALIALDGLTFFSSSLLQCPACLKREAQSEVSGCPHSHNDARTGKRLDFNTWITNHELSKDSVFALAQV